MDYIETEAIVLEEMKYSESSKIIKVFTKKLGKISILVKGALNPKSRWIAVTQAFGLNKFFVRKGLNFYYLENAKIIESNYNFRKNYDSIITAGFISELIEKTFLESDINEKIFELTKKTFKLLNEEKIKFKNLLLAYELKFISFLGYKPVLDYKDKDNIIFSIENGGIVKDDLGKRYFKLNEKNIYYLKNLLYYSLDKLNFDMSDEEFNYLQKIILAYIKYNLDINEFNTIKFLN